MSDTDQEAEDILRQDPVMADLLDTHDPGIDSDWDSEFERLCTSIINQQLSVASAAAVQERVFEVLDGEVTPESVLAADEQALSDAGLSSPKVEYIRNAAEAFRDRDLTREGLADHSAEEVIDILTEIKGVGEWTARMYLLFVLGNDDILPLGDLAIRRGIEDLYGDGEEEMTRGEMRAIAEEWRPYRGHAARYIWAHYESD